MIRYFKYLELSMIFAGEVRCSHGWKITITRKSHWTKQSKNLRWAALVIAWRLTFWESPIVTPIILWLKRPVSSFTLTLVIFLAISKRNLDLDESAYHSYWQMTLFMWLIRDKQRKDRLWNFNDFRVIASKLFSSYGVTAVLFFHFSLWWSLRDCRNSRPKRISIIWEILWYVFRSSYFVLYSFLMGKVFVTFFRNFHVRFQKFEIL